MLLVLAFLLNPKMLNEHLWMKALVFIVKFLAGFRLENWDFSQTRNEKRAKSCFSQNRVCRARGRHAGFLVSSLDPKNAFFFIYSRFFLLHSSIETLKIIFPTCNLFTAVLNIDDLHFMSSKTPIRCLTFLNYMIYK